MSELKPFFLKAALEALKAEALHYHEKIQTLWSGYGDIIRYKVDNGLVDSVVIKHVKLSNAKDHPRGWHTGLSHRRKLNSYHVESIWYEKYSSYCDHNCRLSRSFLTYDEDDEFLMVLEDLDAEGFSARKNSLTLKEIEIPIKWLANFHATFLFADPEGLWKTGTYWHLATRPDELKVLADNKLKQAAAAIDAKLNNAQFMTFVHGDAKPANFCFSEDGRQVAAVDFQYVGQGCGMKDVAYLIGACFDENESEEYETALLDHYFAELKKAFDRKNKAVDFNALELEYRELYHYAWADFHRFLKGWSPSHWKLNSYSEKVAHRVIEKLKSI